MFTEQTYTTRRETLSKQVSAGIILLLGNSESPINFRDNAYPFRQDSTFLYYFGIQSSDLAAIIDIDKGHTTIFGDELSMDAIVWMGRQETLKEKAAKSGVVDTLPSNALAQAIQAVQQQRRPIHFLPPYRASNRITLAQLLTIPLLDVAHAASVQLIKAVVAQRSIKSVDEIAEIEKAVDTSVAMHLEAMRLARPGMAEYQLAAAVNHIAQQTGGTLAYPTILTVRGEILHNHYHGNVMAEGQLLLNDSGAETAMGYAGDLTRTFPVGKRFTMVQKEAYEVVLHALQAATEALKPGTRYLDIHFLSCRMLVEGLKMLGLMHGDTDEAVAAGAHTLFFQCGTGHMIGLDVHDMEDLGEQYVGYTDTLPKDTTTFGLKSLRLGKALQPGYVLTVEPGLYFIPELIEQWKAANKLPQFIHYDKVEAFKNFGGIRIEDNVVITETGHLILGKPLAKTVSAIESIRSEAF
ncbi:aminopeptidase P family protein [Parapedobacter koreensis]|uniref:Xaa-Pro aminopeptidase n=1 Tax=Parapedobacter koreensis TaxID=332977 RepID=A0A1H7MJK9_9SPHI|nr:aminopeptidase P family protein [Parapedobacter koreensis]SEL11476.1 Xaa-Pro aminopeptidase [Parapedobacter koreensis]